MISGGQVAPRPCVTDMMCMSSFALCRTNSSHANYIMDMIPTGCGLFFSTGTNRRKLGAGLAIGLGGRVQVYIDLTVLEGLRLLG